MSQVPVSPPPMSPSPAVPPGAPGAPRPLGTGGWIALGTSIVVGVVYTGVLGTLLALGIGTAIDATADALPTAAPGFTDEPFGEATEGPDAGDPTDPLYDYPGYQDGDAALVLAQPSAEAAIAQSEAAVAAIESTVLDGWTSADDEYYERSENGYGGPSLLYDYISATSYADADLGSADAKQAVVDVFTAAVAPLGFDAVDVADTPAEWSEVGYEYEGDLSDEEAGAALWVVTAYSTVEDVPAIEIGLVDLGADSTGDVERMLDDVGLTPPDSGAFLAGYANAILEEGDRAEFTERMQAYGGVAAT
ncbi:hypothetical protein GSU69_03790 [Rathayibacter festucae]|uniref:Uncharacterized protein n=1 Tax=Rathayibacter festucae TaxID=110937 RepID=A0ABX6GWJ8_9MICO|nr:hypothetical protein [Rathayibacter festucae]QHC61900.1 hypothetical protein GSU69_03790 [Rathayibacter festucae]